MNYLMLLIASYLLSFTLNAQDVLVSLSSTLKHSAWSEKAEGLCDVVVKSGNPPKGIFFISCDTKVSKVRFMEPGIMDITVQIDPVVASFTPTEEQRNSHPIYVAARAKISEMEAQNKKFRKELEEETRILFDEKAMFLSDAMFLILSPDTEFTMYTKEAGALKGTLNQLSGL